MSSPYVYTPHSTYQPTPYVESYYNQQQVSPFIPDANLYPPSPYVAPISPHSPYSGGVPLPNTPRRVYFDDGFDSGYDAWDIPTRQRRPSWHGAGPQHPPYSPFIPPPASYFGQRRHSFSNTGSPYRPPQDLWGSHSGPLFQIHPFLNGESPRPDFLFNLASPTFMPMRLVGPGQSVVLSLDDLQQSATLPPVTRLRIICDLIPQWPIDLEFNPTLAPGGYHLGHNGGPPPITLGDVLIAVHRSLHQQISHSDWAKLSNSEERAVARAYTRRCRSVPSTELLERSHGVRRVDYLLEKVWFRGLIRVSDGWEGLKMVLA